MVPDILAWMIVGFVSAKTLYPSPSSSSFPGMKLSTLSPFSICSSKEFWTNVHYINVLEKIEDDAPTSFLLEINRDRPFVAVDPVEVQRCILRAWFPEFILAFFSP